MKKWSTSIPLLAVAFFPWPEFMKVHYAEIKDGEKIEAVVSESCEKSGEAGLIQLEVAKTEPFQRKGLSNRPLPLKKNAGMIFIFQPKRIGEIWMKKTLIPLQLVHVVPEGKVLQIQEMPVEKNPEHPTKIYRAWPEVDAVLELKPGRLPPSDIGKQFCVRRVAP